MRRFITAAAVALLATTSVRAVATDQPATTLTTLARAAIANHESVARADSAIRRAQANIRLSSAVLLPRLDLNGTYTRYQEAQTIEFAPGESFELRPLSDWSWSADLKQTVFSGLRDWRARDVALLNRDIAELERRMVVDDLVLQVAQTFFETVAAEQRVAVQQAAHDQIEAQRRVAERRFEVGETAIADVSRWRAELAAATQQLVLAKGEAELARRRLERLTSVAEIGRLVAPGAVPVPAADDDELVGRALEERLEMTTLANQIEAAGLWIKIEKGTWLPTVDLNAQYYKQKAAFPSSDWTSVSVTAKVPIYDGGLTAARVAQAKEDLADVELLGRELTKGIADQVEAAAIALRAATAALTAAEERREAAGEAYRQVDAAYRVGEASATDLLEVTASRTDAENSYVIARAQRQLQAISLRRAVGDTPLPDLDPSQQPAATEE